MATLLQQSLPVDSVAITATGLAGLASNASRIGGYALPAVSNRANLDITHLLSGTIRAGTSPTVGTYLDVWMIPAKSYASGNAVWPAGLTGAAGAVSFASMGALQGVGVWLKSFNIDLATSNFDWEFTQLDLAAYNASTLPTDYQIVVIHNMVAPLNATGGNFSLFYTRVRFAGN